MNLSVTGLSLLIVLAVGAAPTSSEAAADTEVTSNADAEVATDSAVDEEACQAVFGDEADHVENHRMRVQRIESVIQMGDHADILYFEDADEPSIMSIKGMTLVSSSIDDGVAEVRIESEAGLPCDDGVYSVETDQSIGRDAHVVAVLDDVVLVDYDGDLRYLSVDGAKVDWNLIWRSRFSIAPPRGKSTPAARRNARVNRARRAKRR